MKGFMGPAGDLKIVRGGHPIRMNCPYSPTRCCGIWCPLFDDSDKDIGEVQLCNGKRVSIMQSRKEK